jgi:hypothetical protein
MKISFPAIDSGSAIFPITLEAHTGHIMYKNMAYHQMKQSIGQLQCG